jgi:hypothetical protein
MATSPTWEELVQAEHAKNAALLERKVHKVSADAERAKPASKLLRDERGVTGLGCAAYTTVAFVLVMGVIIGFAVSNRSSEERTHGPVQPARSFVEDRGPVMLTGIPAFLAGHSEFGTPIEIQGIPNWVKGRRQRVTFDTGRNLLFYTQDGTVVTVYEDTSEGRKKVWGEYSE